MTADTLSKPATKAVKPEGFRQAMAWLHTWAGLLFGWVLFAMFLTGTLAFFRPEISAWMTPEVKVAPISAVQSVELATRYLNNNAAGASRWYITPSTARAPAVLVSYVDPKAKPGRGSFKSARIDPNTGEAIVARATRGGDFFYRFHYELEIGYPWGRWLASVAGMFMLIAIISGIVTHKKIFSDFFTFRPGKGGQRAWMDGHNVLSVLGLPFHLMITFTGIILFMTMLMPAGMLAVYDNQRAFINELYPAFAETPAANRAVPLAPIGDMVQAAQASWQGANVGRIIINHPGDAAATVSISGDVADRVSYGRLPPAMTFDGTTGARTSVTEDDNALRTTVGTMIGLHLGIFAQPLLRWLYFLTSLAGTAMVGTGLLLWVAKRRQKAGKDAAQRFSLRLVDGLNAGTIAGILIATPAFFWANRLIDPLQAGRSQLEIRMFFIAWGVAFVYAFLRRTTAWRDLLAVSSVMFLLIPVVNAVMTSRNLVASLAQGDWIFAGFDLTCIAAGLLLLWMTLKAARATQRAHATLINARLAQSRSQAANPGLAANATR